MNGCFSLLITAFTLSSILAHPASVGLLLRTNTGKTSLLNLLVGDAEPTVGAVGRHLGCRIARLQQHHYKGEQLDPNLTPLVSITGACSLYL